MQYEPIIGMEVHIELKTKSKMFCSCANDPTEMQPNRNICPVCMGHPGTLPVINKKAVEDTIRMALALNCEVAKFSKFDRKSYFYPDLPKGYQISQYDQPIGKNGYLEAGGRRIDIRRIHLEEDTGRLIHPEGADYSLVDLNRAGTPLVELVTEPQIRSQEEAKEFCKQLQLIVRYLGISDADMEKGQMRCEANVSLRLKGQEKLGTKVEIKNLNSFKAVERSIEYEIRRQSEILDEGGKIVQETRGWNSDKQKTYPQRAKEEAHDYRYFPDPDLPPLDLSKEGGVFDVEKIKKSIPELPLAKKQRFMSQYKLSEENARIFSEDRELANYFEEIVSELRAWVKAKGINEEALGRLTKLAANYVLTELQRLLYVERRMISECRITAENFAEFITLIYEGRVSSSGAQSLLAEMFASGGDPSNILEERGLEQVSDENEIEKVVNTVIKNNPNSVADYKRGKKNAIKFLMGQAMKESKGKINPQMAQKMLRKKLEGV